MKSCLAVSLWLAASHSIVYPEPRPDAVDGAQAGEQWQMRNLNAIAKTVGQELPGDFSERMARPVISVPVRWCPAGQYVMDSAESELGRNADKQSQEVTLSRGFWVGQHEVTQAEWAAFMQSKP